MRHLLLAAAALAIAASPPTARAAQITQALPAVEDLGDFTPFDITGARFDPALGALTAVTGELTGTVTANTLIPLPSFPTTRQTTTYLVFTSSSTDPGPNVFRGALADQIVTPVLETGGGTIEGRYTGAPTAVDLTFDFGDVSQFVGPPLPPTRLVEFGFRAGLPDRPEVTGGASDETTFNGSLRLTYTYAAGATVPEPASAPTLGTALLALAAAGGWRLARGSRRRSSSGRPREELSMDSRRLTIAAAALCAAAMGVAAPGAARADVIYSYVGNSTFTGTPNSYGPSPPLTISLDITDAAVASGAFQLSGNTYSLAGDVAGLVSLASSALASPITPTGRLPALQQFDLALAFGAGGDVTSSSFSGASDAVGSAASVSGTGGAVASGTYGTDFPAYDACASQGCSVSGAWTHTAFAGAVPEPGTFAVLGTALLVGLTARRRKAT